MGLSEDLVRISELRASGALSPEEYEQAKQQLLSTTGSLAPPVAYSAPAQHTPPAYSAPAGNPYGSFPAPAPQAAYSAPAQPAWSQYNNGHNATQQDAWLDPHYQRKFARIDAEGGSHVALWNWPAFLFGALWYLVKGMWAKALLIFLVAVISGGFLAIPLWIYAGVSGTYDYYLLKRRNKQLW
jgi:hypothetical protein